MNLTFVGAGYVGLVTAVGFAVKGRAVCCVDVNEERVSKINQGIAPIYEKDLTSSLQTAIQNNKLKATTSIKEGIEFADILFIAVGTPPKEDGSADMSYVDQVVDEILSHLHKDIVIVNKSTVPVGTASRISEKVSHYLQANQLNYNVHIISNPEFLREGEALHDFLYPDRVVIGGKDPIIMEMMAGLYMSFVNDRSQILLMDNVSAEMTKYAANSMLAARISFMNEISRLCDTTGADIDYVRRGIGTDSRIGPLFLKAGIGYGGSCFPKDIDALLALGKSVNQKTPLLFAIKESNIIQREHFISKIENHFGSLQGKNIAVWGLAFKSGTDDVRDSPAIDIVRELHHRGVASFKAYDLEANEMAKIPLKNFPVEYYNNMYDALEGQDALIIMTDSPEFLGLDIQKVKQAIEPCVIFDGRNLLNHIEMKSQNIVYYSIGRAE